MSGKEWSFTLAVNPATIKPDSTGDMRQSALRIRTAPKAVKTMSMLAKSESFKSGAWLPKPGRPVDVEITLWYEVPKSRIVRGDEIDPPEDGEPCESVRAGSLHDAARAVIDALTIARFWPDARYVTRVSVGRVWSRRGGRIGIRISEHESTGVCNA